MYFNFENYESKGGSKEHFLNSFTKNYDLENDTYERVQKGIENFNKENNTSFDLYDYLKFNSKKIKFKKKEPLQEQGKEDLNEDLAEQKEPLQDENLEENKSFRRKHDLSKESEILNDTSLLSDVKNSLKRGAETLSDVVGLDELVNFDSDIKSKADENIKDLIKQGASYEDLNELEKNYLANKESRENVRDATNIFSKEKSIKGLASLYGTNEEEKAKKAFAEMKSTQEALSKEKFEDLNEQEKELIDKERGEVESFFVNLRDDEYKQKSFDELKEKYEAKNFISKDVLRDLEFLKNIHQSKSVSSLILSADEKEKKDYENSVLNIALNAGFDDVLVDEKEGKMYFEKEGQKYLVNEGFFDNFTNTLLANTGSITGGLIGAAKGASSAKSPQSALAKSIAYSALGSGIGASADVLATNYLLDRKNRFDEMLHHALEESALSAVGDALVLGAKPLLKTAKDSIKDFGKILDYTPLVSTTKNFPTQNIKAAQDLVEKSVDLNTQKELDEFYKAYGGRSDLADSKALDTLVDTFKAKFGEDSFISKNTQKLNDILNLNSLSAKQNALFEAIRADESGFLLPYVKEVASYDVRAFKNLKNILNLSTQRLENSLKNLNLNKGDIKSILDELEKGTKEDYNEVMNEILAKTYDDRFKVVLGGGEAEEQRQILSLKTDLKDEDFFKQRDKIIKDLKANKGEVINSYTNESAILSNAGIKKMSSDKAIAKSVDNGFSKMEHLEAVANIKELFRNSKKLISKGDTKNSDNSLIINKYISDLNVNDKEARALLTLKEYNENGKRFYSLELENLEPLSSTKRGVNGDKGSFFNGDRDTPSFSAQNNYTTFRKNLQEQGLLENMPSFTAPKDLNTKEIEELIKRFDNVENLKKHLNSRPDAKERMTLFSLLDTTMQEPQLKWLKDGKDKRLKKFKNENDSLEPYFYLLVTKDKDKTFITHLKTKDLKYLNKELQNADEILKGADIIEGFRQQAGSANNGISPSTSKSNYTKFRKDLQEQGLLDEEAMKFLNYVENTIYNPKGVTFTQLNNALKNINSFYKQSTNPGFKEHIKNAVESFLREDIKKGINEIFKQDKNLYAKASKLYETSLAEYAQMKELLKASAYKKARNENTTQVKALDELIRYAKGQGKDGLNNLDFLRAKLDEKDVAILEMNLLNRLYEKSLANTDESLRVFDSTSFLNELSSLQNNAFKSKEANEFIELVKGFDKLFKNDAKIALELAPVTAKKEGSALATSAKGAVLQKVVKSGFDLVFRNLGQNVLFGAFKDSIQGAALRYHLKKALQKSDTISEFNTSFKDRLKKGQFNSKTRELSKDFLNDVENFSKNLDEEVLKDTKLSDESLKDLPKENINKEVAEIAPSDTTSQKTNIQKNLKPNEIKDIIDKWDLNNPSKDDKLLISKVEGEELEKLKKDFDFKGNYAVAREINAQHLAHALNRHSDTNMENSRNQIPITKEDIANYEQIIKTHDIRELNGNKIIYKKQVNGHYIVIEEVLTGKNKLEFVTMWKSKGKLHITTPPTPSSKGYDLDRTLSGSYDDPNSTTNPIKLQANSHIGTGLASGTLAGLETDEEGNVIGFDPQKFALGFLGGSAGSIAFKKGKDFLDKNPKYKEAIKKELADTLAKGWESASAKYPLLKSLEPVKLNIMQSEKGKIAQAGHLLKEAEAQNYLKILHENPAPIPKEVNIQEFLQSVESVANKENFIKHLENSTDFKQRLAYLNLVEPTLKEWDIKLDIVNKNKISTNNFIKAFKGQDNVVYYIAITKETLFAPYKLLTGFPTTKIREVLKRIKEADNVTLKDFEKARDLGGISSAHSHTSPQLHTDIIAQNQENISQLSKKVQKKFNYDEKKASDLLEWHKNSSPITKDKDGLPKVFYHGSGEKFEVFEKRGWGIWLTPNQAEATFHKDRKTKGKNLFAEGENPTLYTAFVKIKNPFAMDMQITTNGKFDDLVHLAKEVGLLKEEDYIKYKDFQKAQRIFNRIKRNTKKLGYEFSEVNRGKFVGVDKKNNVFIAKDLADVSRTDETILAEIIYDSIDLADILGKNQWVRNDFDLILGLSKNNTDDLIDEKFLPYLKSKGYDGMKVNNSQFVVFDSKQIKHIDNKGSYIDESGNIRGTKPKDTQAEHRYFNEKSPNIYYSNQHIGTGLASGTLAGLETDENGNITGFDPQKFALGFLGGVSGSVAVSKGFKLLKEKPELKEAIKKELADTLAKGWENASKKYPLLKSLEPVNRIMPSEKGKIAQANHILNKLEKDEAKLATIKEKTIKAVDRYAQTQAFKALSKDKQEAILSLKDIVPSPMPNDTPKGDLSKILKHFSSKQDKTQREFYAKLIDDTKANADITLEVTKQNTPRKEYIKAYQHKEDRDLYYIVITEDKDKINVTAFPTTQVNKIVSDIAKSMKVSGGSLGDTTNRQADKSPSPKLAR